MWPHILTKFFFVCELMHPVQRRSCKNAGTYCYNLEKISCAMMTSKTSCFWKLFSLFQLQHLYQVRSRLLLCPVSSLPWWIFQRLFHTVCLQKYGGHANCDSGLWMYIWLRHHSCIDSDLQQVQFQLLSMFKQVKLWFYKLPPAVLAAVRKIQNFTILEKREKINLLKKTL